LNRKRLLPFSVGSADKKLNSLLATEGIAITHADKLGIKIDWAYLEHLKSRPGVANSKSFLTYFYPGTPVIDLNDPFMKLALHPRILAIVNAYMGMQASWYYFTLNRTHVWKDTPTLSQRWHRDPEDRKLLKMFIYLNDVNEESGPFIYVKKSPRGMKYGRLFPQKPPVGYYPLDGEVEKHIASQGILACTGRKGTIIFADTTGLHKGGHATNKERIMLTIGYRSGASPTPNRIISPTSHEWPLIPSHVSQFTKRLFKYYKGWSSDFGNIYKDH